MIDIDIAEHNLDPQQIMEEDITEREQLGKEIAEEKDKPIVICRCRSNQQSGADNRCHNTIQVDQQNLQVGNRIRRVQDKAKREKHNGPVHFDSEESVGWEKYSNGKEAAKRVRLIQQGECPYMKITLLGHEFNALMDSGAGLSLISKAAAETLMQSAEWEHCKQGKPLYKTDEVVSAVNCDGRPLTITGKLILPTMAIGKHDLNQECEYWVMEGSVDEILIANRWLKPLQGALAYEGDNQYLYFHLPNQKLTAGGRYAQKEKLEKNEEGESEHRENNQNQGKPVKNRRKRKR